MKKNNIKQTLTCVCQYNDGTIKEFGKTNSKLVINTWFRLNMVVTDDRFYFFKNDKGDLIKWNPYPSKFTAKQVKELINEYSKENNQNEN